jgi:hypothetical protein
LIINHSLGSLFLLSICQVLSPLLDKICVDSRENHSISWKHQIHKVWDIKSEVESVRHLDRECVRNLLPQTFGKKIQAHALPDGAQRIAYKKAIVSDESKDASDMCLIQPLLLEKVEPISEGLNKAEHKKTQEDEGACLNWCKRQHEDPEERASEGLGDQCHEARTLPFQEGVEYFENLQALDNLIEIDNPCQGLFRVPNTAIQIF